jgi:autotransporter-associated beta strand protein
MVLARADCPTIGTANGCGYLREIRLPAPEFLLTSHQLTLSVANTYTGGTNISAGTLSFVNGALGTTGNVVFTGGSTLQWNGTNTQDISSSGRLRINNGVTATLVRGSL